MSTQSFADLGVSRAVLGSLSQQGIKQPFAIQRDVIGDVLDGRAYEIEVGVERLGGVFGSLSG